MGSQNNKCDHSIRLMCGIACLLASWSLVAAYAQDHQEQSETRSIFKDVLLWAGDLSGIKLRPPPAEAPSLEHPAGVAPPRSVSPAKVQLVSSGKLKIIEFQNSPFPYDGSVPDQGNKFLDVNGPGGRRGHTSARGGISWEDKTFSDRSVAIYVPRHFDPHKSAAIVLFFHGNDANLKRDVVGRQGVMHQLEQSGINALLVAPQLAFNALDSSAGHFWESGFLKRFLIEAQEKLAEESRIDAVALDQLPVVIVAYSGGYLPAAFSLERGGADERIFGVVLFDALFGEVDRFARWINTHQSRAFFFSAYSPSSAHENGRLRKMISGQPAPDGVPSEFRPGIVAFQPALSAGHNDFMTRAWTVDPLKAVLQRLSSLRAVAPTAGEAPKPRVEGQAVRPVGGIKPPAKRHRRPDIEPHATPAATAPPQALGD